MARGTPDQISNKWAQRLSGATEAITQGVQSVQTAPGVLAARQKQAWIQKLQASQDKWATRVAGVSLADWQSKMINVGIPRVASGAAANQDKVTRFLSEFLPHLDRGVATVRAMPKVTLEDSIQRATAMIRHNASFKRGGTG